MKSDVHASAGRTAAEGGVFPQLLRNWRRRRRLSQFDLSLESGVSQRHVSFLESGRAKPSRSMVLQLCETLGVPLRDRNDWLVAGGFAPLFRERCLDDPAMAQVLAAVNMILANHEPYPALALDRAWNIRLTNRPFELLMAALGDEIWQRVGGSERNMLRLTFHPQGLRSLVANWTTIAPLLWQRARREADTVGGEEMAELLNELRSGQDDELLRAAEDTPLVPVLPLVLERDGLRVSLFTVVSTFGTAQDVTADEMRIESFFPADAETEGLFRSFAR